MILKRVGLHLFPLISILSLSNIPSVSYGAGGWEIEPSIEARVGWSDNINFADDDEDDGFVGQVNPGIVIVKERGRLQVLLDYEMQNFYYVDDSNLSTSHLLESIARYGIIPETFFFNSFASAQQVLVDDSANIR